jgi:polysaccharide pyruvyl transferase WcaK-like protein
MSKSNRKTDPPRILLLGTHFKWNLGVPSMALGIKEVVSGELPDAVFTFAGRAKDENDEREIVESFGFRYFNLSFGKFSTTRAISNAVRTRLFRKPLNPSTNLNQFLNAINESDLIIGAQGIMFSDKLGRKTLLDRLFTGKYFGLAKMLKKPVVQYTADFGPLHERWNRIAAKFWLGRIVDHTICRNMTSKRCLESIGIKSQKLSFAPDTGFLMKGKESSRTEPFLKLKKNSPVVGVGISHQIRNRMSSTNEYDGLIVNLCKTLVSDYKVRVLLIPNEMHENPKVDDYAIGRSIMEEVSDSSVTLVDARELSAPELKVIIGCCDAILSSRYHTLVAALSQSVPSIAIGWHHKYQELFSLFNLAEYVIDYDGDGMLSVKSSFDQLWSSRHDIKQRIGRELPSVFEKIRSVGRTTLEISGLFG